MSWHDRSVWDGVQSVTVCTVTIFEEQNHYHFVLFVCLCTCIMSVSREYNLQYPKTVEILSSFNTFTTHKIISFVNCGHSERICLHEMTTIT